MPSHSILVCCDKITARHIEKHLNVFTQTHTHAHARSHTQSFTHVFVQTRIIHNFISALRSTYTDQTRQSELCAAGRVHTARLSVWMWTLRRGAALKNDRRQKYIQGYFKKKKRKNTLMICSTSTNSFVGFHVWKIIFFPDINSKPLLGCQVVPLQQQPHDFFTVRGN